MATSILPSQAGEDDGEQGGQDGEGDKRGTRDGQGGGDGQGSGDGQGDGEKQGEKEKPPQVKVRIGPDGKPQVVQPPRQPTKPVIGDPKQEQAKELGRQDAERRTRPKEPPWALIGQLITQIFHLPPQGPPGGS
jgi:hypothetical protein